MKRTITAILTLVASCLMLAVCMAPISSATELPDNPQSSTVENIYADDSMVNNYGLVQELYGTLTNNIGRVGSMNNGSIGSNTGTISWMYGGTVASNSGTIYTMYGGEVTSNSGTIEWQNYGTIAENAAGGTIERVNKTQYQQGTVTTNNGTIDDNRGTVGTNGGTITDNFGIVDSNTGTIVNNWGTVTSNTGTIQNQYYSITFSQDNSATVIGAILNYDTAYVKANSSNVYLVASAGYHFISDPAAPTATGCTLTQVDDTKYSITDITGPITITAYTAATSECQFWVGGTAVTGTASGTGWSYDSGTNTLTLNAAELSDFHYGPMKDINEQNVNSRAIIYDGRDTGLNIVLQGHSVLAEMIYGLNNAIYVKGDLNISGTGSIHAATGYKGSAGIWSAGALTIDGGDIVVSGCTVSIGSVGNMTFNGGSVDAFVERGSQSIFSPGGDMTVTGGTISTVANGGFDVWLAWGNFSMSGGTLILDGTGCLDVNGTVTISGGLISSAGQTSYVIGVTGQGSPGSDVFTMTGGNVLAEDLQADQQVVYAGSFVLGEGVNLTNLTPKKWDSDLGDYVTCTLAEASVLFPTAAGDASIGTGLTGFTVTFNAGGGSGTMPAATHVLGEYTLPANGFTAPANKEFKCWSVGGVEKYPANVITVGQDTVVTAVWRDVSPAPVQTYTVTYDANGGTGTMATVPDVSGEYTLLPNAFTAPADRAFKCWSVGGVEKNPGDKINVTANVTVKALWKAIPAPEPEYTHGDVGGKEVYTNDVTPATDTTVTDIFAAAKAASGSVDMKVGSMDISFNDAAVSAIGGNTVSIKAELKTENLGIQDAKAVIEVTLDGASFSEGKATVTVPFTEEVPSGKNLVVYFINGDTREKMDASYENGKVVFSTNHFSTYAIVFEDESEGSQFPIWIVIVAVVAVVAVGAGAFFVLKGRKA